MPLHQPAPSSPDHPSSGPSRYSVRLALILCLLGVQGDFYRDAKIQDCPSTTPSHPPRLKPAEPLIVPEPEKPGLNEELPSDVPDEDDDFNCSDFECRYT